jgi:hypothetical protein
VLFQKSYTTEIKCAQSCEEGVTDWQEYLLRHSLDKAAVLETYWTDRRHKKVNVMMPQKRTF